MIGDVPSPDIFEQQKIVSITKTTKVGMRKKPNLVAPRPFRTARGTTEERRLQLFRSYVERLEAKHGLDRAGGIAALSARLGRKSNIIYHWLSVNESARPIPWFIMDLLHYEELLVEDDRLFGHEILNLYRLAMPAN